MKIDFSLSIEDWMAYFEQFFAIIINFFDKLGIQLFADETETNPEEGSTEL